MATRATRKRHKKTPAKKRANKPKKGTPFLPMDEVSTLHEELVEARAQLARIANGENSARRDLEVQSSLGRTVRERLRAELEAMRIDLCTALADLEIARADHGRTEAKLIEALHELQSAHENERLAAHSSADARDRLLDLERENRRLRDQLDEACTHRVPKENGSP